MAQQHRAAAPRCLDQADQRIQPRALAGAARLVHFGKALARAHEVFSAPQQNRHRRIAVAPRTPRFLIVPLDRLGQSGVRDKTHVGLVDAHAERNCRHHYHVLAGDERGLVGGARLGRKAGVIGQDRACAIGQLLGQLLHLRAGRSIDDAGPRLLVKQTRQLAQRAFARGNGVADVGPVEPRHDQAVGRYAQLFKDVGAGVAIGGGGQRQTRHVRERVHQRAQQAIVGTEIVAPFGDAMRLVDGEQAYRRAGQQFAKVRLAGTLGCHI